MESSTQSDLLKQIMQLTVGKDKLDTTFEDSLEDACERITTSAKDSAPMKAGFGNSLLSIGSDDKVQEFTHYSLTNETLNWPLWMALYNQSWVFQRAIDKPAQDEIRCGINILNVPEQKLNIEENIKSYRNDLIQLLTWGRLFGGSLMFVMFDNFTDEDYAKPFNKKKIQQSKTMKFYVVDRWYGVEPDYTSTVSKMSDIDYGKPKYYKVTMPNGTTLRYHHDYVIRYEHRYAPRFIKQGMLQGWGYSEGSHIFSELARNEKLKGSVQSLINKSLIEVIKMSGMRGVFMGADKDNEEQLRKRLEMVNWARNFNSLTFLDKDDEYTMNTFSGLNGLTDLLQQNMWEIAAALEMQGILFGDLKGGFSTDTEALERYDEVIQGQCESYVRPIYQKLLSFIATKLGINEKIKFEFKSLLEKKQDKDRLESLNSFVNLCSRLLADGVISTKKYAEAIQTFTSKGIVSITFSEKELNELDDDVKSQLEGLTFENADNTSNIKIQ